MGVKTQDSLEDAQYGYLAQKMGVGKDTVRKTVETWMYERPLKAVSDTRDTGLLEIIEELKGRGIKILIFSDYPIEDKIKALDITVDGMYAATDKRLNELKPSPKGLNLIMEDFGFAKEDILMIGDRMVKDGQAAINAGCDYLILPKNFASRSKLYRKLK